MLNGGCLQLCMFVCFCVMCKKLVLSYCYLLRVASPDLFNASIVVSLSLLFTVCCLGVRLLYKYVYVRLYVICVLDIRVFIHICFFTPT